MSRKITQHGFSGKSAKLRSECEQDPPVVSCIACAFSRVSVAAETARPGLIF